MNPLSHDTDPKKSAEKIVERVSDIIEDDYDFSVEEDGNILWLIQGFIVNIVKSLLIIGVMVLLIWVIWGDVGSIKTPSFSLPKNVIQTPKIIPKKTSNKPVQKPAFVSDDYESVAAAKWNFWLYKRYRDSMKDSFSTANLWLRDTEDLFVIPLMDQVRSNSRIGRVQNIERLLSKINSLSERGQKIRGFFETDIRNLQQTSARSQQVEARVQSQFESDFVARRGENLSTFLAQKVTAGNQKYEADNQIWARKLFLQKILAYEGALFNTKNIIETNKRALVEDIQVVNFPKDPFNRVLNP